MPSLGKLGQGLPALLGVVLGIRIVMGGRAWLEICFAALFAATAIMIVGRRLALHRPIAGAWVLETWIVSPVMITALVTALIVWLSTWIFGNEPNAELRKTLASTFIGAVTAYAALVWTKDIADGTGPFWPSTQFKKAMASVQRNLPDSMKPLGGSVERQAMVSETVEVQPKIEGWVFQARRRRARIVEDYIRSL